MGKVPTKQVCGHESESPETRDSRVMQHKSVIQYSQREMGSRPRSPQKMADYLPWHME